MKHPTLSERFNLGSGKGGGPSIPHLSRKYEEVPWWMWIAAGMANNPYSWFSAVVRLHDDIQRRGIPLEEQLQYVEDHFVRIGRKKWR